MENLSFDGSHGGPEGQEEYEKVVPPVAGDEKEGASSSTGGDSDVKKGGESPAEKKGLDGAEKTEELGNTAVDGGGVPRKSILKNNDNNNNTPSNSEGETTSENNNGVGVVRSESVKQNASGPTGRIIRNGSVSSEKKVQIMPTERIPRTPIKGILKRHPSNITGRGGGGAHKKNTENTSSNPPEKAVDWKNLDVIPMPPVRNHSAVTKFKNFWRFLRQRIF